MSEVKGLGKGFILHGAKEYRIESVLGHGGCGILYYATSVVMDGNIEQIHEYAIKEYFDVECCRRDNTGKVELVNDSEEHKTVREEFRSEANCLKNLKRHKNIVRVNEVFEDNGTFYYVMEYLKGETLRQFAKERIREKEAINIILPIAKALDYLHSEMINHLDVKPENIMMVKEGNALRPVLIDFGLSKHFKKNGELKGHQGYDGVSEGYSPKEQYEGIRKFSPESDVYSLAATLYFLLTNTDPCSGKEMSGRFLWSTLPEYLSNTTANALNDALNPDAGKRTQDIATFYKELTGQPFHSPTKVVTQKQKTKKIGNKHNDKGNWWKIASIMLGVAAIIILAIFLWPDDRKLTNERNQVAEKAEKADSAQNEQEAHIGNVSENVDETAVAVGEKEVKADNPAETSNTNPVSTYSEATSSHSEPATNSKELNLGYAKWTGGVKNGKPDGVGKMKFTRSHRLDSNTIAEDGDEFDGSFTNGQIDAGKLYRTNGEIITIIGEN